MTVTALSDHRQTRATVELEQRYLQVARQGVLDLTTISAGTVDEDVARVTAASTGKFRDEFAARLDDFVAVVQQANVTATGSVTAAGIETMTDSRATVLVAATSSVSNSSGAVDEPRIWRIRVSLEREDQRVALSDVEFVP
ncbi:MAG: hypothetical protein WBF79_05225 [Rhodococcus sp. (in: high G+C Gram-positive bacteria)]